MTTNASKGTALITGASTGIGAIYAERLARRGYNLILVARNEQKLATLVETLHAEVGRKMEFIVADLAKRADLLSLERRLAEDQGITMLVNNAGAGATKSLVDSSPEELEDLITLNVTALTRLARAAAPGMAARGNGTIINISSIVALAPEVLNGTYGGTKAYVLALTQSMHHELGPKGIVMQAVLPGAIRTAFWDRAGLPAQHLPGEIVMEAEDLVDAALAGLDQGELVTIPSLPDLDDWKRFDEARKAMKPNLSWSTPADRYRKTA